MAKSKSFANKMLFVPFESPKRSVIHTEGGGIEYGADARFVASPAFFCFLSIPVSWSWKLD